MTKSEKKPHPYAEILRAIADGEQVQWQGSNGNWGDNDVNDTLHEIISSEYSATRYRIKPKTIRIGEFDVPEPLRVVPVNGDVYFYFSLNDESMIYETTWDGMDCEKRWLARGMIHSAREAAELHAKALISLTAQK